MVSPTYYTTAKGSTKFFYCVADLPQPEDFLDYDLDSYEGLVRHHVELFYSSAKRYVQESALSQRVRGWQETIDPFLSEQVYVVYCLNFGMLCDWKESYSLVKKNGC